MTGKWDYSQVTRIQQANDIVDVISEHLKLEKKGKEYAGLCPFHTDHRPSMFVNPDKQIFKCFACGAGGDVLKFIQMKENLTFPQTLERLARRAGIEIQAAPSSDKSRSGELDANTLAKLNTSALKHWTANLLDNSKGTSAREYLTRRSISEQSIRQWQLGFAIDSWDDLTRKASENKVAPSVLVKAGLCVEKDGGRCYDKFRNRLMFPILDVTGRIIGFGGRTLGDDPAKYMNSPATTLFDKSRSLYGLYQARQSISESGVAVVVEGYTDVMMAHQFGFTNVVATLGTSLTDGHAHILRRYAKQIVLIFDSDVAGRAAANRAVDVFLHEQIDIKIAFVPQEKDPCEYLLEAGEAAFRKVIETAQDVLEFKWNVLEGQLDQGQNLSDRTTAIRQFLQAVAAAFSSGKQDSLTRKVIIGRLSELLKIQPSQISEEIAKILRQQKRNDPAAAVQDMSASGEGLTETELICRAEQEILEALLRKPELYTQFREQLELTALGSDEHIRTIAAAMADAFEQGQQPELSVLYARIESTETSRRLTEMAELSEQKTNLARQLVGSIDTLQQQKRIQEMKALRHGGNDEQQFSRVMELMKQIDRSKRSKQLSNDHPV